MQIFLVGNIVFHLDLENIERKFSVTLFNVMVKLQDLQLPEEIFDNPLIGLHLRCMKAYGYITSNEQRNKRFSLRKGTVFTASFVVCCCLSVSYGIFRKFDILNLL